MRTMDPELERELYLLDELVSLSGTADGDERALSPIYLELFRKIDRAKGLHEGVPSGVNAVISAADRARETMLSHIRRLPHARPEVRAEIFERLFGVRTFIELHFDRDIGLADMSRVAAMSSYHFLRLFKLVFELTPYQHLLLYRLERAAKLLKDTELQINEVGRQVGFDSNIAFSAAFKQVYGRSPSRYRCNEL